MAGMSATRVLLTDRAAEHIDEAVNWLEARDPVFARRWYDQLAEVIRSLADDPESHPEATLSEPFPVALREVHFGLGRGASHRILFVIRPDAIVVYAVWHVARDDLTVEDLL
jgi:plasmid stabilization system protein ParE